MDHFLVLDGVKSEALTRFQVMEMIERGEAEKSTLAWSRGMDDWRPLGELDTFEHVFRRLEEPEENDGAGGVTSGQVGEAESGGQARVSGVTSGGRDENAPKPRPWIRLFARGVDLIFLVAAFELFFALLLPEFAADVGDSFTARIIAHAVMIVLWCFIEAFFLSTWGFTPGKALFRVSVRDEEGKILGYKIALQRSLLVWVKGLALMFVWVTPIAMMIAHARLMVFGATSWDRDLRIRVSHGRPGQIGLAISVAVYIAFAYLVYETVRFHMENSPQEEQKEGEPGDDGGEGRRDDPPKFPEDVV